MMLAPRPGERAVLRAVSRAVSLTGRRQGRTIGRKMSRTYRVALLGFSEFERKALASCLRPAAAGNVVYEWSSVLDESDFLLADADHAPSVQLVAATERLGETVFIGSLAPADAVAWTARPIDPLKVMRELDALVAPAAPGASTRAQRSATGAEVPPSVSAARPAPPGPPSALLVDDSAAALDLLSSRLRPWGLAVECVVNSSQAIERLAGRSYDFVFIDVELADDSDLDGLALCQHIKRSHPRPASLVVMVSTHQSELGRVRGALAGCDAYLGKPLQAAELERLLLRQGLQAPPPAAAAACAHPA